MTLKNNYYKSWMITFCISNISFKQLKTFQQCTSKWNLFNLKCHRVTQSFMYRVKGQSRAFYIINKADVHVHSFYYKSFLPAVLYIVIMNRKRSPNFTESELQTLLDEVECHKSILFSKLSNVTTNSTKKKVWDTICTKINAANQTDHRRTVDDIR